MLTSAYVFESRSRVSLLEQLLFLGDRLLLLSFWIIKTFRVSLFSLPIFTPILASRLSSREITLDGLALFLFRSVCFPGVVA